MTVATAPAQRYQHSVERIIPAPLGQSDLCVGRKK